MIRARDLGGRSVVDMDAAEKLGRVDKVILDPDARRVVGFVVTRRPNAFGNEQRTVVPASAIHAIGPDAITVRRNGPDEAALPQGLPSVGDLIGRKVVSHTGRFLGVIDDVLISGADCRIVGYTLADGNPLGRLESLVRDRRREPKQYLRADANLRAGRDLIVAPEDAIAAWEHPVTSTAETPPPARTTDSKWFRGEPAAPGPGGTYPR